MKYILMDEAEVESLIRKVTTATLEALKEDLPRSQGVPENSLYASKQESARLLGCCAGTLDSYRRQGKLKAYRLGKSVKFLRSDILGLAKSYTSKQ